MRTANDNLEHQFLERLHRLGVCSIQDVCAELGVTATAVRQRLTSLQAKGLVSRETIRKGRGRPHHKYRVTEAGLRELGENSGDLALVLWRELQDIDEPEFRERLTQRIEEALVKRYQPCVQAESLDERIVQLSDALADRGYDVEVDFSGPLPILRENSCPYPDMAGTDRNICKLEREVISRVLGSDVSLKLCHHNGYDSCEFHVGGAPGGDEDDSSNSKHEDPAG